MATLRLLLALLLVALGTTGAAFAISGYFESPVWRREAKPSVAGKSAAPKPELPLPRARQRFVVIESKPASAPPAAGPVRPKQIAVKAPTRKKAPVKEGQVKEASAWWNLSNLFKN
jgi:hypothetical protein